MLNNCPRCNSRHKGFRLDGSEFCESCGQRWDRNNQTIPSADRRVYESQTEVKTIKKQVNKEDKPKIVPNIESREKVKTFNIKGWMRDNMALNDDEMVAQLSAIRVGGAVFKTSTPLTKVVRNLRNLIQKGR